MLILCQLFLWLHLPHEICKIKATWIVTDTCYTGIVLLINMQQISKQLRNANNVLLLASSHLHLMIVSIISTNQHCCQLKSDQCHLLPYKHNVQNYTVMSFTRFIKKRLTINSHQTVYLRYKRYVDSCVRLYEFDENLCPYVPKQIFNMKCEQTSVQYSNYFQLLLTAA